MFLQIDSKYRSRKAGRKRNLEDGKRLIGRRRLSKADNDELTFPTFLELSWELAAKKQRNYVKFRAGATPPNVSGGGAFL
jgi:hypothetical protein